MQYLEQYLEQQERIYNSKQLATVLEQERQVNLSADRIRCILQNEDEYDLATAIIKGMEARSVQGNYTLERFKFNSA